MSTRTFDLHFSSQLPTFLERTTFSDQSELLHLESARAKRRSSGIGAFSWSPAVRGLILLSLRTIEHRLGGSSGASPRLRGGLGTLAASLDFALSKRPLWLLDMFGMDRHGLSNADLIFSRRNAERKRGGDVDIWIDETYLAYTGIRTHWMGEEVREPQKINFLIQHLFGISGTRTHSSPSRLSSKAERSPGIRVQNRTLHSARSRAQGGNLLVSPEFAAGFEAEAIESVKCTNVFSPQVVADLVKNMTDSPRFRNLAGKYWRSNLLIEPSRILQLTVRARAATSPSLKATPLKFGIFPGSAMIMLVAQHLKKHCSIKVDANYDVSKAGSLVHRANCEEFDLVSLPISVAPQLLALRNSPYRAVAVLPSGTVSVLKSSLRSRPVRPEDVSFEFPCVEPSTGHWALDHLFRKVGLTNSSKQHRNVNLVDQLQKMPTSEENVRFVSWYPYSYWAKKGAGTLECQGTGDFQSSQLLFFHQRLVGPIRDELLQKIFHSTAEIFHLPSLRKEAIRGLLSDVDYVRTVGTLGGAFATL